MIKYIGVFLFFSSFSKAQLIARYELFGSVVNQEVRFDSPVNSQNRVLEQANLAYQLELRPDFQWQINEKSLFILRSRHFLDQKNIPFEVQKDRKTETSFSDLTDAYYSVQLANSLAITAGLQNYQWGPAEILSPSNIFYHFNNEQRSFFYKEKGRSLVRVNWDVSSVWSVLMISEPMDNRTPNWIEGEKFYPQTALKLERQFANPANNLAFLMGRSGTSAQYLGGFFNRSFKEAYSVYLDSKVEHSGAYFRPEETAPGTFNLNQRSENDQDWKTLAVFGFRAEGTYDFRQEFIWNEAGYDRKDWRQVLSAVSTPSLTLATNLQRLARSGLELPSKAYSYTSVRFPDQGKRKQIHLSARWLNSLVQESSALQLNYEHDWNEWAVVSAELLLPMGAKDTEFNLAQGNQGSLGVKISF